MVMDDSLTKQRVDDALRIASDLLKSRPNDSALPIVIEQLNYLTEVYNRDRNFRAIPPNKMTLGLIAARVYDTIYPEFADILHDISWALKHQD